MFGGLIAAVIGLFGVNQWAKEDVKEKKRRADSKAKYYFDKHGNWRLVATGHKATYDDFKEDSEQFYHNADLRKYALYKKRVKMNNSSAKLFRETHKDADENLIYSIFGIMRNPISFDDWVVKGKEINIQYNEEIVHDDYFYHLHPEDQDYYLGIITWDEMYKISKIRELKRQSAPEAYDWVKKHYNISDEMWDRI